MYTAVFDIGKTNKKFSIFDEGLKEVHREYTKLPETKDEDGFPTEDLSLLTQWMKDTLKKAIDSKKFDISKLNFSTYGASFVHLDENGNPVTPLYNYLKPFPDELWEDFYKEVNKENFWVKTASPSLGMLNSGLQLFWLKKNKPEVFKKIKYSLHFPQYCSYVFSKQLTTEYTSLGCHTALWDFEKNDYHEWAKNLEISNLFPECVSTSFRSTATFHGQELEVGTGIHDSSAALLPYLRASKEPFLLLSTGTWNITFNPFNKDLLTQSELNSDCLNYMQIDGSPVKASRLFFGNEFNLQTKEMEEHFENVDSSKHHSIRFDQALYSKWSKDEKPYFNLKSIYYPDNSVKSAPVTLWSSFANYEEAYHRFMIEMMWLQSKAIKLAAGASPIKKIFIDGGFSQNDIFINLLKKEFPTTEIVISISPLGSSLGAAMCLSENDKVLIN